MDLEFKEYVHDFNQDIRARASSNSTEVEEAFTEAMSDLLVEFGEVDDYYPCTWLDRNIGARVDAYYFDDDMETVSLMVNVWKGWNGELDEEGKVANRDIDSAVKRATNFATRALTGKLPSDRIDETHPAYDLAVTIQENHKDLTRVRIIVLSDGIAPQREGISSNFGDVEISVVIWDIQRVFSRAKSGTRVGIKIDFNDYGGAVPCVAQRSANGFYTTYLAFVTGEMLADLYDHHKTRLLEMNVRVFLSQRVKVNQGIRDTILNEPSMFGAYNNGITVYAEDLETTLLDDGRLALSRVHDFQIVNGGQSTASLYHTRRSMKCRLDDVFVQMKIMVIHEAAKPPQMKEPARLSDLLVPRIGRFSNSQNRVQMSDLQANDPPHPELHAISLRIPAPDPTGGNIETFWFYEKSRGAWDERRRLEGKTVATKRLFDAKYPRHQRFEKGLFSKVWYAHHEKPDIVSLGPQKCFAAFNSELLSEEVKLAKDSPGYWLGYFKRTVALIIIWNSLEKRIKALIRDHVYQSYAQNLTAYTISLFSASTHRLLNLEGVWNAQDVPVPVISYLLALSEVVHEHILDVPLGVTHVPEWCKRGDCWIELLKKGAPAVPNSVNPFLGLGAVGASPRKSDGEEAVQFCVSKGSDAWKNLAAFLKQRDLMGGKQRSQAFNMGRAIEKGTSPSPQLSVPCMKIWEDAVSMYGWV
jgi:hypothetical protein